jgi:hypothetical protein
MVAALAVAGPVAAASAQGPFSIPNLGAPDPNQCLQGLSTFDPGPFGPLGPYGPSGPYGANGPLHGQANPLGNAATCGGLLTYILRGGNLVSFVQASTGTAPGK